MTPPRFNLRVAMAAHSAALETLERRTLLSGISPAALEADVWSVAGDARGRRRNDAIVLDLAADGQLRASVNGEVVGTRPASAADAIEVWAGRGNDTVRVELGANLPAVASVPLSTRRRSGAASESTTCSTRSATTRSGSSASTTRRTRSRRCRCRRRGCFAHRLRRAVTCRRCGG
jgi:hypothetical protein